MAKQTDAVRDHLSRFLDWEEAHVGFDEAVDRIPADKRGARPAGFEHSAWQQLEHIRIAQEDILDFCLNPKYEHRMKWPDDYWPKDPAPPNDRAWTDSIASCRRSRDGLTQLTRGVATLAATAPTGRGAQAY